jgi:epoxyqueuosine reductase
MGIAPLQSAGCFDSTPLELPAKARDVPDEQFTQALKEEALRLGFDLVGACPAVTPPGVERFRDWLAAGYGGRMAYLADRAEAYGHPSHVLDGVRSILMLGMAYRTVEPEVLGPGSASVSRYAWGGDYHDLIHDRLRRLADLHRRLRPEAAVRGVVDTAPLLEKEFARLAGLGWIGKNTLLLNRRLGSWFFLAALLSSEPLDYDQPHQTSHCGTCQKCLEACPTGALVDAYRLDARRCISYLTIELGDLPPPELREPMGPWLFGCDACQEVCPWNRRSPSTQEQALHPLPGMNPVDPAALLSLDAAAFRRRFRGTSLWRAKRRGLLSNAAIVLGNAAMRGSPDPALEALCRGLNDEEPIVRAASAWALGRCPSPTSRDALCRRLAIETDAVARAEIEAACG